MDCFDTTAGNAQRHKNTVQPAVEATSKYTEESALEAMNGELERLRQEGRVPGAIYDAARANTLGRRADVQGSGSSDAGGTPGGSQGSEGVELASEQPSSNKPAKQSPPNAKALTASFSNVLPPPPSNLQRLL